MSRHDTLCPLARAYKVASAVMAGTLLCSILSFAAGAQPARASTCTDSLQAKIDAAPVGGTVTASIVSR
jgi:hypothetical protein